MTPEQLFRLLADSTRLRCALLLQGEGSLCVCELTYALELSQPKVSRHLAMLREGGLVEDERRGQWVHYRLRRDLPGWVIDALQAAACGSDWARDRSRLVGMGQRPSLEACS